MSRQGYALTPDARENWEIFESEDSGCSCHNNPPCSHCTDPGNPANLDEGDNEWEPTLIHSEDFESLIEMSIKLHADFLSLVTNKTDADFKNVNDLGILLNKLNKE